MLKVLFVCTGNTCRSSMAEAIFKKLLEEDKDLSGKVEANSAGVAAFEGDNASANAINVLKKHHNLDLTNHKARLFTEKMLNNADLILTMSSSHKRIIDSSYPENSHKVFVLKEFVEDSNINSFSRDICDPYGGDEEIYKKCSIDIKNALQRLIIKIKQFM